MEKTYKCGHCGAGNTAEDLAEFEDWGEEFWLENSLYICPDCFGNFSRNNLETQLEILMKGGKK